MLADSRKEHCVSLESESAMASATGGEDLEGFVAGVRAALAQLDLDLSCARTPSDVQGYIHDFVIAAELSASPAGTSSDAF